MPVILVCMVSLVYVQGHVINLLTGSVKLCPN
jgi:hypothetical protein